MGESGGTRLPCQGCGRLLVPLGDGTAREHTYKRRTGWRCQSSGYRLARWPVGQFLRHHSGDIWRVLEDRGGKYGDYYLRCVEGREHGREMVAHGEYMHRHGWTPFERGGERFVLRPFRNGFRIARLVDDTGFEDAPFWVEAEILGYFRSREAARDYMLNRPAPSDERPTPTAAASAPTRPSDPAGGETARFTTEEP